METKKIWTASYWYDGGDCETRSETRLFYVQEQAQAWVEEQLRDLFEDDDYSLVLKWYDEGQNKLCTGALFPEGADQEGEGEDDYEYVGAVEVATFG